MPFIRFTIHADCDTREPSRIVPAVQGEIFELEGESDNEVRIGQIDAYLILRGRALNEHESLFEAMDSIDSSVFECYEALFDPETDDWNHRYKTSTRTKYLGLMFYPFKASNWTRIIGGKESALKSCGRSHHTAG